MIFWGGQQFLKELGTPPPGGMESALQSRQCHPECPLQTEENNRLFPDRPVTEKKVAISTGVMNSLGPLVGGVPMCHGAGGMAGHVRFGAKTGGSLIILGVIILVIALVF